MGLVVLETGLVALGTVGVGLVGCVLAGWVESVGAGVGSGPVETARVVGSGLVVGPGRAVAGSVPGAVVRAWAPVAPRELRSRGGGVLVRGWLVPVRGLPTPVAGGVARRWGAAGAEAEAVAGRTWSTSGRRSSLRMTRMSCSGPMR